MEAIGKQATKLREQVARQQQNLKPEIPRCCPSSLAIVMKRCWDANLDKRPKMDQVVSMSKAIDASNGGGMILVDQLQGCFCFRRYRGPLTSCPLNLTKDDMFELWTATSEIQAVFSFCLFALFADRKKTYRLY